MYSQYMCSQKKKNNLDPVCMYS
uniref:Uncharacterized protein n=1 Tax=Anguilla anguilla TaxID=7936 RepID=A0A0E9TQD4_ANGAN